MRTLDRPSARFVIVRDLRLLVRMASMVLDYWRVGGRIRREYRQREARGETYWVDAGQITHREEALRRR